MDKDSGKVESDKSEIMVLGLTSVQWTVLSSVVTVLSGIGVLVAIAGLALNYFHAQSAKNHDATKEVLHFVERWEQQNLFADIEYTLQEIEPYIFKIERELTEREFNKLWSDGHLSRILAQSGAHLYDDLKFKDSFNSLREFSAHLALCLKVSVCSKGVSKDLFGSTLGPWLELFYPFMVRENTYSESLTNEIGKLKLILNDD